MPHAAAALKRCFWTDGSALYDAYHDHEWGRPVTDDVRLFEKISLVAKDNASATDRVRAETREQTDAVAQMNSSASELTNLSDELKTVVSRFKLGGGS